MRIGELAAIAGVTTRTVRHYHRIGLLPEPERQPNGYREYGLRHAVELARVRRLAALGLSLDEVRDALTEDAGKDLHEILAELDTDLARQQEAIARRRARLAELLRRSASGGLRPEEPVSPELAALFENMARTAAGREGPQSAMAARERELLGLLETTADTGHRDWLLALTTALSNSPRAMTDAYEIYARLDALADADPGDPRIEDVARAVADSIPDGRVHFPAAGRPSDERDGFADAFFADFPAAQAEVLRRAMRLLQDRGRQ